MCLTYITVKNTGLYLYVRKNVCRRSTMRTPIVSIIQITQFHINIKCRDTEHRMAAMITQNSETT